MRIFTAFAFALLLSGCSTLGSAGPGGGGATLDVLRDDVGSVLVAFDLPRTLGPAPSGQLFTYDAANGGQGEHLRLLLVPADIDAMAGSLPPPEAGRTYYLFGLSDPDKALLRAAQALATGRGLTAKDITIGIVPHLCTVGAVDANLETITIVAGVPGQTRLSPFLDHQSLADLLRQPGSTQMPACL